MTTTPGQPAAPQPPDPAPSWSPVEKNGWSQPHRWLIVGAIVILAVLGVILYQFHDYNQEAKAKADQLVVELGNAGLSAPADPEAIAKVLGTDGGPVCDDPGGALRKALADAQMTNGASFVGQRPVRARVNLVRGERIVLQVYCPEKVPAFDAALKDYVLDEATNG